MELLREITTTEEFDNIVATHSLDVRKLYEDIESPVVLRHYLATHGDKIDLIEAFFVVSRKLCVDLLEEFFPPLSITVLLERNGRRLRDYVWNCTAEGLVDIMTFFLNKGFDINSEPLSFHHLPFLSAACANGKVDIVDLFLERGSDVNIVDYYGETPVFYAARRDDVRVLDRLIVHGADLHHLDRKGNNLWSKAAFSYYTREREEVYHRLVQLRIVPVYHDNEYKLNEEQFIKRAIGFSFRSVRNKEAKERVKKLIRAAFRGEQYREEL